MSMHKKTPSVRAQGVSDVKTFDGVHQMNTNTVVDMRKFVEARNGEVYTSTQQVAEAFEKLHNHVIAKVRALDCSAQFLTDNFSSVQFEHRGNTYEAFEMTKDGFMFLVMSFTGKKAAAIKEGYISAFNWMAQQLGLSSKTLVEKTVSNALGVEGARTLSNVMRCRVAKLGAEHRRSATAKLASALHARFNVPRMELIPSDQMDAACNFIAAYVLEGEWIPKQAEGGMHFNKHETQDIYLLMSDMAALFPHRENLLQAAGILGSKSLMEVGSMIGEARLPFRLLDKRRKELYQNYRSLGMDGGYAMGGAV